MLVGTPARSANMFENTCGGSEAAAVADRRSADSIVKKLIGCGFPRSVMVKSSFFRSVTGSPRRSWTTTLT